MNQESPESHKELRSLPSGWNDGTCDCYCFTYFFTPMLTNSDVVSRNEMMSVVERGYRMKTFNCTLKVNA